MIPSNRRLATIEDALFPCASHGRQCLPSMCQRVARKSHGQEPNPNAFRRPSLISGSVAAIVSAMAPVGQAFTISRSKPKRGKLVKGIDRKDVFIRTALVDSRTAQALDDDSVLPTSWPYSPKDFQRWDERNDATFYDAPSFDSNVDSAAKEALEQLYSDLLASEDAPISVLDLCASWDCHLPANLQASKVAVVGLNATELRANAKATEVLVQDLNKNAALPFDDHCFDFASISFGIGYLTRPRQILVELHRVVRPGGLVVVAFSSRSFPSKVVSLWARSLHDGPSQCQTVATYFRNSPLGGWHAVEAIDVSPKRPSILGSDPLWAVTAIST